MPQPNKEKETLPQADPVRQIWRYGIQYYKGQWRTMLCSLAACRTRQMLTWPLLNQLRPQKLSLARRHRHLLNRRVLMQLLNRRSHRIQPRMLKQLISRQNQRIIMLPLPRRQKPSHAPHMPVKEASK